LTKKEISVLTKESSELTKNSSVALQPDKLILKNVIERIPTDKPVMDKADIKNLLMSVALKSENVEVDFLPRLLQKSGILMESKLADIVKMKNFSATSQKSESISQKLQSSSSSSISTSTSFLTSTSSSFESTESPQNSNSVQIAPFPTKSSSANSAAFIQEDIKGAVLNFIANSGFEASESISLNDIHSFQEFVQNLENVQLLNSHLSESGKYIIPFPLFSGDQFSFGQLLIDLGQKDKDDENGSSKENSLLKVSLFLEMTNLGPVRADFSVLKNNITGGFQVADQETADFFNSMLPELKERLQTHEYNVHRIECRVVEPEKLAEKSIINELLKSEEHGLSLMI
ncbi:MAG: flagellar hook-length control protein FliK, partial [Desulfamplus sp.]|nr:flagellar hook-length control protein FliK [Desulfamplus sp.]